MNQYNHYIGFQGTEYLPNAQEIPVKGNTLA